MTKMKDNLFHALTGLRNYLVDVLGWYSDSKIVEFIDDIRYRIMPDDYDY